MKKIIFINNLGLGGAERVVSRLFNDTKIGKGAQLWTLNSNSFYDDSHIINKLVLQHGKFTFFYVLYNLLKLGKDTIVQAHLNLPILYGALAKMLGARFELQAVHCFAYSSFYKRRGLKGQIHKFFFSSLLKMVKTHIFKAQEMVKDFEDVFGWSPSDYKVVYNPYDINEIIAKAEQSLVSEKSLDNSKLNVAIVGRLNVSKRVFDIITIAKNTQDFAVYHFFGDGPLYYDLVKTIEVDFIKNITVHGMVSNPFKYVKKCGVYLSLSESEGFPNALVEAMICGAIPIHSNCKTGPKEILCDDFESLHLEIDNFKVVERGILFNVGDTVAVIKAITYVSNNRIELTEQFKQAHFKYIQSVSINKILGEYSKILRIYD